MTPSETHETLSRLDRIEEHLKAIEDLVLGLACPWNYNDETGLDPSTVSYERKALLKLMEAKPLR